MTFMNDKKNFLGEMLKKSRFLMLITAFLLLVSCSTEAVPVVGLDEQVVLDESKNQTDFVDTPTPTATIEPPRSSPTVNEVVLIAQSTPVPPLEITTIPTSIVTRQVTATPTPTMTIPASPTTEPDRFCPETTPLKPEYDRYFLSANIWPTPDPNIAETHFWLSKPLPGAGRTLINQRFPYGWDENGRLLLHNGIDIAEELGTDVIAVEDGTIVVAQSDVEAWYGWRCDWYGHLVVLELEQTWQDQPIYVLYGHVLNLKVAAGERVSRGQPLAEIGVGGAATNPHLHLEVRVGQNAFGSTRNPMLWIDPGATRGVIAGRLVDPKGRPWQGVPLALAGKDDPNQRSSTWSYLGDPQQLMNPDEGWAENFVFSDIRPGEYDIYTQIQGIDYKQRVTVAAGELSVVEIVTEPLREAALEILGTEEPVENDDGGES